MKLFELVVTVAFIPSAITVPASDNGMAIVPRVESIVSDLAARGKPEPLDKLYVELKYASGVRGQDLEKRISLERNTCTNVAITRKCMHWQGSMEDCPLLREGDKHQFHVKSFKFSLDKDADFHNCTIGSHAQLDCAGSSMFDLKSASGAQSEELVSRQFDEIAQSFVVKCPNEMGVTIIHQ